MSVLLLCLLLGGGALAMPQQQQQQGYNYQIVPANSNDYPQEQYQLLQQQIEQQQQLQQPVQQQPKHNALEVGGNIGSTIIADNADITADLEAQLQHYIEEKQLLQQQQEQQQQQQQQNTNLKTFVLEVQPQQEQQTLVQQQQQQQQQQHLQQQPQQQSTEQQVIIEQQQPQQHQPQYQQPQYEQPQQQQQRSPQFEQHAQQPTQQQQQQQQQIQLPQIQVPQQHQQSFSYQAQPASVQYNKEFYYLSAPQEDFEEPQNVNSELEKLRRNVRVVFIRAPEQNGIANAALQLAKQSIEAQTAIYVLSKQHDAGDLANKLQQIRRGAQKPEVVFIKYRTPAEAAHAQQTIQAQYEALDGPNHFNHDGVAPTHNFVGSLAGGGGGLVDPRTAASQAQKPDAKYLPASAVTAKL